MQDNEKQKKSEKRAETSAVIDVATVLTTLGEFGQLLVEWACKIQELQARVDALEHRDRPSLPSDPDLNPFQS